jgi:hypothetical protein
MDDDRPSEQIRQTSVCFCCVRAAEASCQGFRARAARVQGEKLVDLQRLGTEERNTEEGSGRNVMRGYSRTTVCVCVCLCCLVCLISLSRPCSCGCFEASFLLTEQTYSAGGVRGNRTDADGQGRKTPVGQSHTKASRGFPRPAGGEVQNGEIAFILSGGCGGRHEDREDARLPICRSCDERRLLLPAARAAPVAG